MKRRPDWIRLGDTWRKPGQGRYCKRQLAKARRRFARAYIRDGEDAYAHTGSLYIWESTVNYRNT